jgi:hypothetical protein
MGSGSEHLGYRVHKGLLWGLRQSMRLEKQVELSGEGTVMCPSVGEVHASEGFCLHQKTSLNV